MADNTYNTIVVGGGIAGLTSAAYLSRTGQKVLLIEKNKECGGLVNSFTMDGFHFDAGVRALEDAGIIHAMLKDKIIAHFSFTPLSIENRVGSSEGAIVGWSFQESMPVVNKIQISDRSVFTPIPSVFQAGQWAYSPAGVPMSILTGKLVADKVIKKKKR